MSLSAAAARVERDVLERVIAAVLDRARVQRLCERLGVGGAAALPYEAAVVELVRVAQRAGAGDLERELDRACETERTLVASVAIGDLAERLLEHEALGWPHHGARLVWAVLRDPRPDSAAFAPRLAAAYMQKSAGKEARAERPAPDVLASLDEESREALRRVPGLQALAQELDKSRAELIAEQQARAALDRELREVRETLGPPAPVVGAPGGDEADPKKKLQKLERRLEVAQREAAEGRAAKARVAELEEEVGRLKERLERLRELHAQERATWKKAEPKPPGPAVSPPPKPKPPTAGAPRLGVFLDVANLSGAARRLFGRAVDYRRLMSLVVGERRLVEGRAYAIDKGDGFDGFARALRALGLKVLGKRPKTFPDGTVKADWDVGLAVDALSAAEHLDAVVLGSGDGDLVPVVNALKARGLKVEVVSFEARTAVELQKAADVYLELDDTLLE